MKLDNTLVYFGAEWCTPCKVTLPIVEKVAETLGGNFKHLDVDDHPDAFESTGFQGVPAIVYYGDNNSILYSKIGAVSEDTLLKELQEVIK